MSSTLNPAGYCGNCGHGLSGGEEFCTNCGTQVLSTTSLELANATTIPIQDLHNRPTVLSNAPTPPLIIQAPTDDQIYRAMVSKSNPYADWGKLAIDDESRRVFRDASPRDTSDIYLIVQEFEFPDFAFQIQVRNLSGGLLFRALSQGGSYYFLSIEGNYYALCIITPNSPSHLLINTTYSPALRTDQTNLLAVVAQENIIDLYINLSHMNRIKDNTLSRGTVGLMRRNNNFIYTHAKVWKKRTP